MRSLVGIITILATVIHFTFGCCLHACHVAGHGESPAVGSVIADACCHDEIDGGGAAPDADHGSHRGDRDGADPSVSDRCHDCAGCQGCHCAALSTGARSIAPWASLAPASASAMEATLDIVQDAGREPPPDRHGHRGRSRPALFERLSI